MTSIRCILVLVAASLGTADFAVAQNAENVKPTPSPSAKPSLAPSDAAALDWLRRAEAAMGNVERIPLAFDKTLWAHWMVQSYLDLGRPKDALSFAVRFQQHFEMAFVRNAIRYVAYQLAAEGRFKEAHDAAQLLYTGIPANPHVRQHDVYVDLLVNLAALEARAGDFSRALRTAKLIPANGNSHWAKARGDAFGFIALAYARAGDLQGLQQIKADFAPRDNDWLQAGRLLAATELAKGGAFADAEKLADGLPAMMREAFFAGEAVELVVAGKFTEGKAAIAKLPRREQREAAWRRVSAAVAFKSGAAAATEFVRGNEEAESAGAEEIIGNTLAWMGKFEEQEIVSANPFGSPAPSLPGSSGLTEISREVSIDLAFPRRAGRRGGVDPFSPPALLEIDDVDIRATVTHAKELVGEPWNAAALSERLQSLNGSIPAEDFQQQAALYTALASVANVVGDKQQVAALAESAAAAAERIEFRRCAVQTRLLLPMLVQSGRPELATQFLGRLLAAQTLERNSSALVAHALVAAGEGARVDEVLSVVGNDAERAAVCLGAARGCIMTAQPAAKLPLVRDEWDLIAKLKIRGDENFPRSEWSDRATGYLSSLGHGHPMWLERTTWPDLPQATKRVATPLAKGEKP